MGNCRKNLSSASNHLKCAACLLTIVLVLHVVAFSTPNWTTLRISWGINTSMTWLEGSDHGGLWQICSCHKLFDGEVCSCFGRHGDAVWFKVTQTLETFALVGYIICGIISSVQLFIERDRKLKRLNVFILLAAGLCAVLGLVIFGIRSNDAHTDMAKVFGQIGMDIDGRLDFSFHICCISVFLCLFVSLPLYIKDEKIPVPEITHVTQELPVVFNSQGQMVMPSHIQGHTFNLDLSHQSPENHSPFAQAHYGAPPAYSVADQQEINDVPAPPFNEGIPYKE